MEQDLQDTGLLYDFLYLDIERIKTLISQMSNNGVLKELKTVDIDKEGTGVETEYRGEGSIPGFAKGATARKNKALNEINQSLEKQHDPSFLHPVQLLDLLSQFGNIKKGIAGSILGNIVLTSGAIRLFDVATIINFLPAIGEYMKKKSDDSEPLLPPSARKQNKKVKDIRDIEFEDGVTIGMVDSILNISPSSIQVTMRESSGDTIWTTLASDSLTIKSSDLALKYGSRVSGCWHMLGIVDALPDNDYDEDPFKDDIPTNQMEIFKNEMFINLVDMMKNILGRPENNYSVTPLIIFRTTSGNAINNLKPEK